MARKILHQFVESVAVGDAVSDSVFQLQGWLQQLGFVSDIYVHHYQTPLKERVKLASLYRPNSAETHLIYHHAAGTPMADTVCQLKLPIILIYHNITPAAFFTNASPKLVQALEKGRQQLALLRDHTALGLGDSRYNANELDQFNYTRTGVLPIVLDEAQYDQPSTQAIVADLARQGPNLLFIGRLTPNKRQDDLLKLMHYYRKIRPNARLHLVGKTHLRSYRLWLTELAHTAGLAESINFAGHVSWADMVTYYRAADCYVSMSEHEGFGKPLIESMYHDLPVVAYSTTAVPFTMADAGLLFNEKHFEALAELIDLVIHDKALRQQVIAKQRQHVQSFLPAAVFEQWQAHLRSLSLL